MKWKSKLLPFRDRNQSEREHLRPNIPIRVTDSGLVPPLEVDSNAEVLPVPAPVVGDVNYNLHRSGTRESELSKFDYQPESSHPAVFKHARQRSADRRSDPLGLSLLYTPEGTPSADIIFVHGLGGTSRATWSYNRDPELFWPKMWLPLEPDICTARILTFGYNAHFLSTGPNSVSGISDFAKSLLFDLKFGKDDGGEELEIGKRPIVFVVHSMGGLVFKKAYIQGSNNDEYKGIISQVRSVLFLSTPHRGTNLADILNRILAVSIFNHATKQYINELKQNSPMIDDLNEEFPNYIEGLKVFSFYETLETQVGLKRLMVLPKSSATLGYKSELSEPLDADHHHVCKFANRNDSSYKRVRSVLKTLISSYREAGSKIEKLKMEKDMQKIEAILGSSATPEDEYTSQLDRWRPGTCGAMLSSSHVVDWQRSTGGSKILWIHAQPGSGKSVKAAVQIRHMQESGLNCSYYFFKYGDATKRSPGSLLRSLAFQVAQVSPIFRKALLILNESGIKVEKMEARIVWEKLFVGTLFKLDISTPMYFLIDALDESDSVNTIVGFFSTISVSRTPIRILITSRKTPEISTAFDRISSKTAVTSVSATDNLEDIRLYAAAEMEYMHGSPDFRQAIVNEIVEKAEGNFLWAHLALKEILQCHSPSDIKQILSEMPPGMEALYKRMESAVGRLSKQSDFELARMILAWATYSRRPLDAQELVRALQPEMPSIIDLRFTINQLCGHFVVVDGSNRVTLIHQTAREYLVKRAQLPFSMSAQALQEELFRRTLSVFLESQIRSKATQTPMPPFYEYAITSWAYHLSRSSAGSDTSLTLLVKFLESSSVLYWIRMLATLGELKLLILASNTLNSFVEKRRRIDSATQPSQHRLTDLELLSSWAVDLLKLVGKFGRHILQDPSAIQNCVPQFCPKQSAIFKQFAKQAQLSVKGISNEEWDDCLARVSVPSGHQAMQMVCSARHIAVFTSGRTIVLWNSATFEEVRSLFHEEHIFAMCFTDTGDVLVSYGYYTTKIWNVNTGRLMHTIINQQDSRALCIAFSEDDTKLLVGLSSRKVVELSLKEVLRGWNDISSSLLEESTVIEGAYLNAPTSMAFSADRANIAVAYRGFPLTIWSIVEKKRIRRCRRRSENGLGHGDSWVGVNKVVWHPNNEEVLGIYTDGIVFKWDPFEDTQENLQADLYAAPSEIQCSPNGVVFTTSDVNGVVRLYNYEHFSLIYQLDSEDIITSLCFSPDSRRFYDLRGSYCNAWEPNALFRLPDTDEQGSEIDTEAGSVNMSHHPSEAWAETSVPITALSARPEGGLFCAGNDDGLLELHDLSYNSNAIQIGHSRSDCAINLMIWSEKENCMAYSDSETITVMKVTKSRTDLSASTWKSQVIMDINLDLEGGMIQQLLLHPEASYLIISGSDATNLWSCDSKTICKTISVNSGMIWANHPLYPGQVLSFSLDSIKSHHWKSLDVIAEWHISTLPGFTSADKDTHHYKRPSLPWSESSTFLDVNLEIKEYLDEVIISQNREYALISISQQEGSHRRQWSSLKMLEIRSLQDSDTKMVSSILIPEDIMACIERSLEVLGKDQFVFLDRDFWVCTWPLRSTSGLDCVTRHFFLPRDWICPEVLQLCRVMADGTFLCPRKGQVAVIRSSLGRDW